MSNTARQDIDRTHPAWESLLEHRFDASFPEPEGWNEALAHMDDCAQCRTRAVAIDPTLGFRRLPAVEVDADDITAMLQSVSLLRRNRELTGAQEAGAEARQARGNRWWLPTAAALAVGMGLGMTGGGVPLVPKASTHGIEVAMPSFRAITATGGFRDFGSLDTLVDSKGAFNSFNEPVLEGVENPAARIYQYRSNPSLAEDETIAVAFVIDPTIDV